MSAIIHNRKITCPHCKESVTVRRSYGAGAGYVRDWNVVPLNLQKLMTGIIDLCEDTWYMKADLRNHWDSYGMKMSDNAANARVSELVGLGVLRMIRYPDTLSLIHI